MRPAALWIMVAFAMHLSVVLTPLRPRGYVEPPGVMSFDGLVLAVKLLVPIQALFFGITYVLLAARCVFSEARRKLDKWSFACASLGTLVAALTVALGLAVCVVERTAPHVPGLLRWIAWVGGGVLLTLGARELRRHAIHGTSSPAIRGT